MSNNASYRLTRRPSTTTSTSGGYGGGYGLEYKPLNWLPNWEEILDKPLTYTPSAHTHAISEISNLQGALDEKLGKTERAADSSKLGGLNSDRFIRIGGNHASNLDNFPANQTSIFTPSFYNTPTAYGVVMNISDTESWQNQLVFGTDGQMYFRQNINNDSWRNWVTLWHSGNSNLSTVDWSCKQIWIAGKAQSRITSENSSHLHYYTDATDSHWFNKAVRVAGEIYAGASYNQKVWHAGNSNLSTVDWNVKHLGMNGDIYLRAGNRILGKDNATILQDHANGNVTLSATANDLYMGYGSTNNLRFHTNGALRAIINSDGNMGIGLETGISARLHVAGKSGQWAQVLRQPSTEAGTSYGALIDAGASAGDSALRIRNAAGNREYLHVRGDGNVGIGTVTPNYTLTIGDSDTGFNWHSDGLLSAYANGVQLFNWNSQRVYFNNQIEGASYAKFNGQVTAGADGSGHIFYRAATTGYSWHNGNGALTVDVMNNGSQTPLLLARRAGDPNDRLFSVEQLNSGTQVAFIQKKNFMISLNNGSSITLQKNTTCEGNLLVKGETTGYTLDSIVFDEPTTRSTTNYQSDQQQEALYLMSSEIQQLRTENADLKKRLDALEGIILNNKQ